MQAFSQEILRRRCKFLKSFFLTTCASEKTPCAERPCAIGVREAQRNLKKVPALF